MENFRILSEILLFQIPFDVASQSPSLAASPSLLSPHYRVPPLPTLSLKPSRSPCHGDSGGRGGVKRPSRSVAAAADAERRAKTPKSSSSNIVPHVTIDSAVPEVVNNS